MDINDIYNLYDRKIEEHSALLNKFKKQIHTTGTLRLLLIVAMLAVLWTLRHKEMLTLLCIAAVFLLAFLILVIYHTKLEAKRMYEEGLIDLNKNERKALDYDFSAFDGAQEESNSQHPFSLDLDIFGKKSIFQLINRTVTQSGRDKLINWIKEPLNDKKEILLRQDSIREIAALTSFRQDFYVIGNRVSKENRDSSSFLSKNKKKHTLGHRLFYRIMIWAIPAIWIALIFGAISGLISINIIGLYFAISFILVNIPAKQIKQIYSSFNKTEHLLKAYSKLIRLIEQNSFHSGILKSKKQKLFGTDGNSVNRPISASKAIKNLSNIIGALDQRYSMAGLLMNLLYMRDTRQAINLEKWEILHGKKLGVWFDVLSNFDALSSLGNFAFNHPQYIYPEISDSYFEMKGKALGHPLIHRDKCVHNDIEIPHSKFFTIITGANMAGKSTYLRTAGVNFLLACIGTPAFAQVLRVYPAQLVTSLRTSDSLASDESYFFAELKRLKMIIDRLNNGEKLFIILDEILKGTNSTDKQKGSVALIKQLVNKNTCGIIATHDLMLGELSETFPKHVNNKRFEAEIKEEKLVFTYKMSNGIAQNMNATFLMKKMGIFEESDYSNTSTTAI